MTIGYSNNSSMIVSDCCKEIFPTIGVMGDCSKWGTPTGNEKFCSQGEQKKYFRGENITTNFEKLLN